jgi:hypothetical protein
MLYRNDDLGIFYCHSKARQSGSQGERQSQWDCFNFWTPRLSLVLLASLAFTCLMNPKVDSVLSLV